MKRSAAVLSVFLAAALMLAPAASADRKPYVFDKAHSEINFVAEALFLTAHGYFERFEGDVQIDPEKLTDTTLTITIETASINTRNERRDNHLRSADFFDAANFPKITFVSRKVTAVDAKNLVLDGDLTIRGVTKPIQIPLQVVFLRDGRGRFKGGFNINRKEFNISYNSRMNPIEDMVAVLFDINLMDRQMMEEMQRQRQQQQPPAQRPPQ